MKKVTKHIFETSDGKPFDIKADAEKHEAGLSLAAFFGDDAPDIDGHEVAAHIIDDLDRFAEIIRPLIRKPRAAKAEAQADDYEAQMAEAKTPSRGKSA